MPHDLRTILITGQQNNKMSSDLVMVVSLSKFQCTESDKVAQSRFSQKYNIGNSGNNVISVFLYIFSFLLYYSDCIVLVNAKFYITGYKSITLCYVNSMPTCTDICSFMNKSLTAKAVVVCVM